MNKIKEYDLEKEAGLRYYTNIQETANKFMAYWSTTYSSYSDALRVYVANGTITTYALNSAYRFRGQSVRLVKDVQ